MDNDILNQIDGADSDAAACAVAMEWLRERMAGNREEVLGGLIYGLDN